jgi:D-alanine-D-alanine ligase
MRIGIAFTLKPDGPLPAGAPDDLHEEFDSPATVRAVGDVLRGLGHEVRELGDGRPLLEALLRDPPDFVFNFAEGAGVSRSREARVPAVCEMLGLPYSGSDPLALAAALDKDVTRRLAADAGVAVPRGVTLKPPPAPYDGNFAEFPAVLEAAGLPLPVIAKPALEGSSKGVRNRCLVERPEDLGPTVASLWADYGQAVLVEEFVVGDEVTVGIVGNDPPQVIGTMHMIPRRSPERFVYSLEVKRDWDRHVEYVCPPRLPAEAVRAVEAAALAAFDALGCRDVARADFRVRGGVPYFLEINPLPGLNPESSDLCYLAYRVGLTYPELIRMIFAAAVERTGAGGGRP